MEPLRGDDPRQIGRYKLVARLGAGGMGQVFLGFSPSGRPMAVKVVHRDLARDQAFLHRFRQEVAAARKVSGAYTAPVVDAGYDDLPWLATTLVVGPSLADAVAQQGPLPEAAVWRLAAGLVEALAEVHSCGLVHRDLKPSNVLLAADGPRLIDFGISRALDGTAITGTSIIGTPAFMSPEQASGAPVGPASDVFSLGGTLTFAATGSGPFGDGNPVAMIYRVVHGEPVLAGLPGALPYLVSRCLAKGPEDRATLAELMEVITANLVPAEDAMSFWPQGLGDFIGSYQARLSSGTGSLPPLVPEEAQPEPPAPEQVQARAPEQVQARAPEQVQTPAPDGPTGPTGSGDQHPATEVAASHGQEEGPETITAQRARPIPPEPGPPPVAAPSAAAPPVSRPTRSPSRRRALAASIGVLAVGILVAVVVLVTSSSPPGSSSSGGSPTPRAIGNTAAPAALTVEATEQVGATSGVPAPYIAVRVLPEGHATAVADGALFPAATGSGYVWTTNLAAGTYQVCVQPPTGMRFVGANTDALPGWFCTTVRLEPGLAPVGFALVRATG
jgi:eukaryotic-like serine/threonine-protein kinase